MEPLIPPRLCSPRILHEFHVTNPSAMVSNPQAIIELLDQQTTTRQRSAVVWISEHVFFLFEEDPCNNLPLHPFQCLLQMTVFFSRRDHTYGHEICKPMAILYNTDTDYTENTSLADATDFLFQLAMQHPFITSISVTHWTTHFSIFDDDSSSYGNRIRTLVENKPLSPRTVEIHCYLSPNQWREVIFRCHPDITLAFSGFAFWNDLICTARPILLEALRTHKGPAKLSFTGFIMPLVSRSLKLLQDEFVQALQQNASVLSLTLSSTTGSSSSRSSSRTCTTLPQLACQILEHNRALQELHLSTTTTTECFAMLEGWWARFCSTVLASHPTLQRVIIHHPHVVTTTTTRIDYNPYASMRCCAYLTEALQSNRVLCEIRMTDRNGSNIMSWLLSPTAHAILELNRFRSTVHTITTEPNENGRREALFVSTLLSGGDGDGDDGNDAKRRTDATLPLRSSSPEHWMPLALSQQQQPLLPLSSPSSWTTSSASSLSSTTSSSSSFLAHIPRDNLSCYFFLIHENPHLLPLLSPPLAS